MTPPPDGPSQAPSTDEELLARGFGAALEADEAELEPMVPDPSSPTAGPLAERLRQAVTSHDEARFLGLVEAVLLEPDETAVSLLAPYLGEGHGIGRVAAHGLLMLGPPALDALLEGLSDGAPGARVVSAWALGSLPHWRTTEALLEALGREDATPALIKAAIDSLAEVGDRKAVTGLLARLRAPEFADYRAALCRALGFIGDTQAVTRIAPLLSNPKPELRLRAAEALIRLSDRRGWPVLFGLLRGDDVRGESQVAALRGLGELSSALAPFLGDDDYHTRVQAAEVLGSFGDTRAVQPLIETLGDISPWVRGAGAYALGRLGDRRAFKHLIMSLKDDSAWVRQSAVRALALLNDPRARKPLEDMLFDADPEICAAAQEALNVLAER